MTNFGWLLTMDELRRTRLLEYFADRGLGFHDVADFYGHDESLLRQAIQDVDSLAASGMISPAMGVGGLREIAGQVEPRGTAHIEVLRNERLDRSKRRWACRSALIKRLYDQEAEYDASKAVTWDGLDQTPLGFYYGERLSDAEIDEAAGWLWKQKGLIGGIKTEERIGPARSYLTESGVSCAEHYDADVRRYVEEQERRQPTGGPTITVHGGQNQIATGDRSQQTMNIGASIDHIKLILEGLSELLRVVDLGEDQAEAAELYQEALDDLDADKPTGKATERFLKWIEARFQQGASAGMTAMVGAAATDAFGVLEHVIKTST